MACRAPTGGCRTVLAASLGIGTPDTDDVFAFNATSTAETISEGLDLGGLTYLVTGATGGLGGEVCRVFALRGARVVLACRSLEKGESVAEKIRGEIVGASLVVLGGLDLGSAVKTKTFAETFCALALPLNGIVCCAGVVCEPFGLTCDGRETHFGVNHLGHFLLVDMLLDECVNTAAASGAQGRIVLVSSGAHHFTYRVRRGLMRPSRGFDWTNLDSPIGYDDGAAYAQSKLANVLHAAELDERLVASGVNVAAFAVDPGTMAGELRHFLSQVPLGRFLFPLAKNAIARSPERAAATVVWCAAAERKRLKNTQLKNTNYYQDCASRKPSLPARDPRLAKQLWEESERLLGMRVGSAKPPEASTSRSTRDACGELSETAPGASSHGAFEETETTAFPAPPRAEAMSAYHKGLPFIETERPGPDKNVEIPVSQAPLSPPTKVTPSKSGRWGLGLNKPAND